MKELDIITMSRVILQKPYYECLLLLFRYNIVLELKTQTIYLMTIVVSVMATFAGSKVLCIIVYVKIDWLFNKVLFSLQSGTWMYLTYKTIVRYIRLHPITHYDKPTFFHKIKEGEIVENSYPLVFGYILLTHICIRSCILNVSEVTCR